MSMVLDREMPQKKRRYGFIILLLGLLAVSVYGYYSLPSNVIDKKDMAYAEEKLEQKSSVSESSRALVQESAVNNIDTGTDKIEKEGIAENSNTLDSRKILATNTKANKLANSEEIVDASQEKKLRSPDENAFTDRIKKTKISISADSGIIAALDESSLKTTNRIEETKAVFKQSEVLSDIENIPAILTSGLDFDRELQLKQGLADTPISITPKSNAWNFSALALIEHIPNFNSTGYGLGLGIDKRISAKWSASLRLAYMRNTRSLNPSRMALEADMPVNEEDMQSGTNSGFLSARNLEENTDQLNSIALGAHLSYKISGPLAISTGMTVERYSNRLDLIPLTPDELALNQMEEYIVKEKNEFIANFDLGIEYSFNRQFSVMASFRKSLKDYYADETDILSTSKFLGGLKYSF